MQGYKNLLKEQVSKGIKDMEKTEETKEEKTCSICEQSFPVTNVIWSKTLEGDDVCEHCYDAVMS